MRLSQRDLEKVGTNPAFQRKKSRVHDRTRFRSAGVLERLKFDGPPALLPLCSSACRMEKTCVP